MVHSRFLIIISRPSRSPGPAMAPHLPQRSRKPAGNLNPAKPTSCHRSLSAAADVAALLAVLLAFSFLLLPCLQLCRRGLAQAAGALLSELRDEPLGAPAAFLLAAPVFLLLSLAAFTAFLNGAGGRKCGNSGCRRLRDAADLGVRIETDRRPDGWVCRGAGGGDDPGRLFLALSEGGRWGELEAELGRMAPQNGRAVLLSLEKRGCAVGRMAVHGPKKARKAKR